MNAPAAQDQSPLDVLVENLTVTYNNGNVAVRDAGFRLEAGTVCALVGINGSGKSTLFKSIMGFIKPAKGRVTIGGESIDVARRRNWMAYVP
jgi:manganese/iron transport system ATP-binding protein